MASSYSMKPKPFISLISVILPDPWVLKCSSTSCLVTAIHSNTQTMSAFDINKIKRRVLHRLFAGWWDASRKVGRGRL